MKIEAGPYTMDRSNFLNNTKVWITGSLIVASSSVLGAGDPCQEFRSSPQEKCPYEAINRAIEFRENENLRKLVDQVWMPEYYIKYQIDQFLAEVRENAPHFLSQVRTSLESKTIKMSGAPALNLIGFDGDLQKSEGTLNLAVTKLLESVAKDVPGVSSIARSVVVKLAVNGRIESSGAQIGEQKTIVIESLNTSTSKLKTSLGYIVCNKDGRVLDLGTPLDCGFETKVTGNFERKITNNVSIGGNFSEAQKVNEYLPEGNLFFKIHF